MDRLKEKRTSRRQLNTLLINEAKDVMDSADFGARVSLTERLEANNSELDRLNAMIEEYVTDEEFTAEFEMIIKYQDAARGMLGELKARQEILRHSQSSSVTAPMTVTPIVQQ